MTRRGSLPLEWILANIILLIVAVSIPLTLGISLQSTSYTVKTASLFGNDYQYAMFEAQFDEEVYMMRQWPCQCVNSTLPCVASPAQTNPPGINESIAGPVGFHILTAGEWYRDSFFVTGGLKYFKFSLPYDPSMPCPIVTIDVQQDFGELNVYAATSFVPTILNYEWLHNLIQVSTIAICPSHPLFVYGDYYVLVAGGDKISNMFSIRYTLQQSPTCANISMDYSTVEITSEPANMVPPIWLEDGVAMDLTWPFNASNPSQVQAFYALYAPSTCASFSIAIYPTLFYDPWLMLSGSNEHANPSLFLTPGSAKWYNLQTGMNKLDLYMCNPDTSKNYSILYVGLFATQVYPTPNPHYQLIGTTQRYSPPVPLSSLGYTQITIDQSFGIFPELQCDNAEYQCGYVGANECTTLLLPCCFPFMPVPPEHNAQALWPWSLEENSVESFPLPINFTAITPFVPGKLATALHLGWTSGGVATILAPQPSQCVLQLGNSLVDKNGDPLPITNITFIPTSLQCDYEKFKNISRTISELKENYLQAQAIPDIALTNLQIAIQAWNDDYIACSNYIQNELTTISPSYDSITAYVCTHPPGIEYAQDACCNLTLLPYKACHPTLVNRTLPVKGQYLSSAAQAQCKNPQCSESTIQTFIQQQQYVADPQSGCTANLYEQASHDRLVQLLSFIAKCKDRVQSADLLGFPCVTNSDCYNNVTCLPDTRRCNNTNQDIFECLAQSMDRDIAISLLNVWNIPGDPSVDLLVSAFEEHWLNDLCVGPKGQDFRAGNKIVVVSTSCIDECRWRGLETYCPDPLWMASIDVCPWNPICNVNGSSALYCYRTWQQTLNDTQGCLEARTCNWRRHDYWPCLPESEADCSSLCVNNSISANVCLDCSKNILGSCLEVTDITDGPRCEQGLCSAGLHITDPIACSNAGNCSVSCPTCDTPSGCASAGICSDTKEFGDLSGACIFPALWTGAAWTCSYFASDSSFYGSTLTSIGCAQFSISQGECQNLTSYAPGAFWYTTATNKSQCESVPGNACFDSLLLAWYLERPESECLLCDYCFWKPVYTYSPGVWTPGTMQDLSWQPRTFGRSHTIAPAVDYTLIMSDISHATSKAIAHAYYTEALCRYENVGDLVDSIICDCDSSSSQCFANSGASPIGSFRICPYQANSVGTLDASVTVPNNSVPIDTPCQTITLATTSVGKYQVPPDFSVTNQLFKKIQQVSPYWIVENSNKAVVGMLISNAINVTIPYSPVSVLTLCIQTETFITIDPSTTLLMLAQLQDDNTIRVYDNSEVTVFSSDVNNGSRISVCGYVNNSGTWFAVAVVDDYASVNPTPSGQTVTAFVFYILVIVASLLQGGLILRERHKIKLVPFKLTALAIIVLNGAARMVYILPPRNAVFGTDIESIAFIIYELPTFLYFSVFTVIMYLWSMVMVNTRQFGRRSSFGSSANLVRFFISVNVFMYFVFVVFIYLTAILPSSTQRSPCYLGSLDSAVSSVAHSLKVAYWCFQCVVSIILCGGFFISAFLLLRMIIGLRSGRHREDRIHDAAGMTGALSFQLAIITSVAVICIVFILVRSIVFLVVAVNNSTLQIMTFCMLEVIPQFILVVYLRPPHLLVTAFNGTMASIRGGSTVGGRSTRALWNTTGAGTD